MKRTNNEIEAWGKGMRVGTNLLMNHLSQDLYPNQAAGLWELVKNAMCACFPDPSVWQPALVNVELSLVRRHPLAPDSAALVCMDHGRGFTEPDIERFLNIGGDEVDGRPRHGGAAQKQLGRFAYFMLNSRVAQQRDKRSGFFILTRTSSRGPVLTVAVTPESIEQRLTPRYLEPDARELGAYANHKGSFSAIVIPHSVFESEDELVEALRWKLPRKKNLAVKVSVGGKVIQPPPLAKHTVAFGKIEAYLDLTQQSGSETGIWLTDAATGLRCAFAPAMGSKLPYPLARPDLEGDIFIPDLLQRQTTNRDALKDGFLRSKAWLDVYNTLQLGIAPFAQELLGDKDVIGRDKPREKMLYDLADQFRECWGDPLTTHEGPPVGPPVPPTQDPGGKPKPPKDPPGPPRGPRGPYHPGGRIPPRERQMGIRIGDRDYYFTLLPSGDPLIYAHVGSNGQALCINPNYAIKVEPPTADREHCLGQILQAVAMHGRGDAMEVREVAAKLRLEFEQSRAAATKEGAASRAATNGKSARA